jgi:hypothetical protein
MKRFLFFLIALSFFFGAIPAYGAEAKNPAPKAKPSQESKSLETTYYALIIGKDC